MQSNINDQIADYRGLVEALALRLSRSNRAQQVGADYDDLAQEGLIAVWRALVAEKQISAAIIELRMVSYLRWLGRPSAIPYEDMLPLEDFAECLPAA